jgi:hypothetical protein
MKQEGEQMEDFSLTLNDGISDSDRDRSVIGGLLPIFPILFDPSPFIFMNSASVELS